MERHRVAPPLMEVLPALAGGGSIVSRRRSLWVYLPGSEGRARRTVGGGLIQSLTIGKCGGQCERCGLSSFICGVSRWARSAIRHGPGRHPKLPITGRESVAKLLATDCVRT